MKKKFTFKSFLLNRSNILMEIEYKASGKMASFMDMPKFNMNPGNTFSDNIPMASEPMALFVSRMEPSTRVSSRKMPSMEKVL